MNARVNYDKLRKLTKDGIVALNNILDYGYPMQPLDYNRSCIDDWRSIGLGFFGMADMFIALGITYGSDEANGIMESIMFNVLTTALQTSCDLAKEHGVFQRYDWECTKKSPLIQMLEGSPLYSDIEKHGLRNGTLLSIAPAGTISTMCGVSNGCEPLFAVSYERTSHSMEKQGKYFKVYAKSVEGLLEHHGLSKDLTIAEIKAKFPFVVDSHDILPKARVRTQAILQQYCDNAISSTVNLCNTATVQDIFDTYMLAWELGCKGITVFRAGCKRGSILGSKPVEEPKKFNHITPVKRKDIGTISGTTIVKHTACAPNMYVTVNKHGDNVLEVFTNTSQGCNSNINTITRMASLSLRSGVKVDEVVKELRSNICSACTVVKAKGSKGISVSCGAAIAEAIEEVYLDTQAAIDDTFEEFTEELMECPECSRRTLRPEGKCVTCSQCGYSRCD